MPRPLSAVLRLPALLLPALLLPALLLAVPVQAQAGEDSTPGRVARTPDPAPDDPLREAKLADRKRIAELNIAEARSTGARDRASIHARDATNAHAQARYHVAMAEWRKRVAACEGGDWSQCQR